MNQYIMILTWTLIMGAFYKLRWTNDFENTGSEVISKPSVLFCIFLVAPLAFSAALRTTFGDQGYKIAFRAASTSFSDLVSTIQSGVKGPGYYVVQYIGGLLFGNNAEIFFFAVASLQMTSLVRLYRKYSTDLWMGIFIFVASTDYLSWMQNGIRQFIAVTLILMFSDWIFEKKYIHICIVVLIAATIHTSALIMLPIVFIVQGEAFNKKTIIAILGTVVVFAMLDRFISAIDQVLAYTEYNGVIADWQQSGNDGVNPLRVLVYSMPTIISSLGIRTIRESGSSVINITCNMGIVSTLLYIFSMYTSGIYVGRLPIYCSLYSNGILLPWLIRRIFSHKSSKLLVAIMIIAYVGFYYYQTHYIWGII